MQFPFGGPGLLQLALLAVIAGLLGLNAIFILMLLRRNSDRSTSLIARFDSIDKSGERIERALRDEIARNRQEAALVARQGREETRSALKTFGDSLQTSMTNIARLQKNQLETFADSLRRLTESNENRLEGLRNAIEAKLKEIQGENGRQLEQMRATVDEKLQGTLEKRLSESFKQVSERLEQVHKGLGEMQTLATGVGDLKRVLTNVKTRGTWGEIQLGSLLEQVLAPEQYERNVRTNQNSLEAVEFAIKLPGRDDEDGRGAVWLPIDAKFPTADYQRLVEAQENCDRAAADQAAKDLCDTIKNCAKTIREKYLNPPATTDFGIMFLPAEGLYAEVIRMKTGAGWLVESLQRECRVIVAGPTTLAALLNSLQLGFRTLAVQKGARQIERLLGAVKSEFGKFGIVLEGVRRKLDQAANTMDEAAKRSRAIEKKLGNVHELPSLEARALIGGDAFKAGTEDG
ncbi:MAG: DNA recombination protein RmuC [Deltaproteobacteria bacterium]|jgi:DNA recombination protein RmuC|nr:DNA recombination protein RmuC [Deltaproteobacteria bacterium]